MNINYAQIQEHKLKFEEHTLLQMVIVLVEDVLKQRSTNYKCYGVCSLTKVTGNDNEIMEMVGRRNRRESEKW